MTGYCYLQSDILVGFWFIVLLTNESARHWLFQRKRRRTNERDEKMMERACGWMFVCRKSLSRKKKCRCLPSTEHETVASLSSMLIERHIIAVISSSCWPCLYERRSIMSWDDIWACVRVFLSRRSHKDAWPSLPLLLATCSNVEERKKEKEKEVHWSIEIMRGRGGAWMNGIEQVELICIWKCSVRTNTKNKSVDIVDVWWWTVSVDLSWFISDPQDGSLGDQIEWDYTESIRQVAWSAMRAECYNINYETRDFDRKERKFISRDHLTCACAINCLVY